MPIQLDALNVPGSGNGNSGQQTTAKIFSPKFFDSVLTGVGKKTGILREDNNPQYIKAGQSTSNEHINTRRKKFTNGNSDVTQIPLNILTPGAWELMHHLDIPDATQIVKIAELLPTKANKQSEVYLYMPVHSLVLEETTDSQTGSKRRELTACYQVMLFLTADKNDPSHERMYSLSSASQIKNWYYYDFTCNPLLLLNNLTITLTQCGYNIDADAIYNFINNYSLYSYVCKRSEEWQTVVDVVLDKFFENVVTAKTGYAGPQLNDVTRVLRYLEDYSVPLDLYRNIYNSVSKHFKPDEAVTLCKQNLNLLLSDTLQNLNKNKASLTCLPANNPPVASNPYFSKEQKVAIESREPLILVQAGAGTGKSTVILGRIDHMIACGVNPADITVLSFTNAAADHITEKNPNIHSMTIARMIHTIYTANFTNHELSSIDTIINSLDIYYPDDDRAYQFKKRLIAIKKNDSDSFTAMNNFIEAYYDEVIAMLDRIQQTSLELEIIICYQQIENFVEPAEVASKYLIIDEVQDNSIFEFIYTLKYVDKHKESLFIVGDSSQTLYEFRASNPKALNVLEGSGVFATYQLQVNYRSNQEILDFANVVLENIEANQYAHIQLQANSLNTVTEQSFTDKVRFNYMRLRKIGDFKESLGLTFAQEIKPYIDEKLALGEKVAVLAFTRDVIFRVQGILQNMYPDKNVVNLIPDKMYNTVVLSEYIKKYWSEVQFVPTKSIMNVVAQGVLSRLDYLVHNRDKALPTVQSLLMKWIDEQKDTVDAWQQQYMNGILSLDQFLEYVKESMLQFEIKNNAIKQALLSARNEENKKNQSTVDADFLLSTIHSAKGLEFDNVIVIHRNENDMPEDKKRMYYVAFTRAMRSEYILTYDVVASPKIQGDYETIVKMLHTKAVNQATAQTVVNPMVQVVNLPAQDDDNKNGFTPVAIVHADPDDIMPDNTSVTIAVDNSTDLVDNNNDTDIGVESAATDSDENGVESNNAVANAPAVSVNAETAIMPIPAINDAIAAIHKALADNGILTESMVESQSTLPF